MKTRFDNFIYLFFVIRIVSLKPVVKQVLPSPFHKCVMQEF
jgi:hypothetical protein